MEESTLFTVLLLAALTLLPFALMTATSFVKVSVVFSVLRNALGTGQVPSGILITGLSAILTLYIMAPVGEAIAARSSSAMTAFEAEHPLGERSLDALFEAGKRGVEPLRAFLGRHAGERERSLFVELARRNRPGASVTAEDLLVLLPAFLITELSEAFQIGFLVFIPFLVTDMVVANVLLSLGMHMVSPTTVSLPLKLLLFVLVDGWYLLARALVLGYG